MPIESLVFRNPGSFHYGHTVKINEEMKPSPCGLDRCFSVRCIECLGEPVFYACASLLFIERTAMVASRVRHDASAAN